MADGGEGGEGGGSSQYLSMEDLVQAMLTNSQAMLSSSQALAEALAADRARREAADRIQRESWEAALKEKDAELDRIRAESADAKKKLQADASRKMRWEAAYEVLLGANKKLAELRDADMEDSKTYAETPNSKEVENCTNLSQNTVGHPASDFNKLKQAYDTLSSKKDKEVSALLSEKDSLRSQLDIMQQDYAELLKSKEVEAAQPTEAALMLQKSVDELKALAQKKDGEIGRLQAEAVGAKMKHDNDLSALLSEKDSVHNQLSIMQQDYTELLKKKKVLTHKKNHEIVILRAVAVGAKKKVQKMHAMVKEKDDEIQRLKGRHPESVQKYNNDITETHEKSRSVDPAVTTRDKLKNSNLTQTVEQDHISETKTVEKDGQGKTTQERRGASSMSNGCEMSGSDEDADGQNQSGEDGDEQSTSVEDGDEQSISRGDDDDDDGQSRSDEHGHNQSGSDKEITSNPVLNPPENHKRKRNACNAETANGKSHSESNGSGGMCETKTVETDVQEKITQKRRCASSMSKDDEKSGSNEDDDEQIGSDEDGEKQIGSDEQSGSDEDGDEQSGSDEDGDGDDDNEKQSGSDEGTTHNERKGDIRTWGSWRAPAPLRQKKLKITDGRRYMVATGHWGKYVKDVNDSLVNQPDKHKEFVLFLHNFQSWRAQYVARTMEGILDGQPKLIRQFNRFLPNNCQIYVKEEEEEKQLPEGQRGVPQPRGQPPSASPSASAAAGLIKLKEAEQQSKWERV